MEILVNAQGVCGCGTQGASMRPCIGIWNWGGFDGTKCEASSQNMTISCGQCKLYFFSFQV